MPRKHTKRVDAVLAKMRRGEVLCKGVSEDGFGYWLEPSCDTVGPVTAGRVIERPEIEKGGDALLGESDQTYRYRNNAEAGSIPLHQAKREKETENG